MGHGHDHGLGHGVGAAAGGGTAHRRPLALALGLALAILVLQVVFGFVTGSLALLSDAGHVATDALGLALALAAIQAAASAARRREAGRTTFGLYRLEILAALANAVLLFVVAGLVLAEAVRRLGDPPEVAPLPVLVVGAIGLAANLVALRLLRPGAAENLNVRGAATEVLADALGSVGVIVSAGVTALTDWAWVDPVMGAALAVFILPRAVGLGRDALHVLVQAAPRDVDITAVRADLAAIPGVVDVHDLHVWTLTSAMDVASAHVMVRVGTDPHGVLDQARQVLAERHHLDHATVQVEPEDHLGCDEISW